MNARIVALFSAGLLLASCKSGTSTATLGGGSGDGGGCGLRTCQSAGAQCGLIGDGCGGTVDCGGCPETEFCGGGGPSKCGGHACTPATCERLGAQCGPVADGCGGTLSCGGCDAGFCGGGGANRCGTGSYSDGGSATCHPRTCSEVGANCGPVADGCGGLLSCGSCGAGQICGGGGAPSVCGTPTLVDGGQACTNLCLQQVSCDAGSTTLTGKVYAPNGVDPLYGALVYVPNGAVQPFTAGVACLTCDADVSGDPLVATTTAPDGSFSLSNVPVGSNIPLVVQVGRWRRVVQVPTVSACGSTAVPANLTRLPKDQSEGDIPLTAVVTGDVDALECVLRKIGVADAEFSNPDGGGRIQLFVANSDGGGGAAISAQTPAANVLTGDPAQLSKYDLVLFGCEGGRYEKPTGELSNLRDYANAGGRVFATHFEYTWLYTPTTWQSAASWNPGHGQGINIEGTVDTSFQKGASFSSWLDAVGASTAPGSNTVAIQNWRWDVDAVNPPAQQWITIAFDGGSGTAEHSVQHLTFNTPYGAPADQQCGRVLFSDFHVANASTHGTIFPSECTTGALTAQEHILEFMLFDLASCISPDNRIPGCTPRSCADQGANCGPVGDGCGGVLQCGDCPSGESCGGGGQPSVCGTPACIPMSCAEQGIGCGAAGDGCGGTIECGSCPAGQTCGGGGVPNQCGAPACTKTTCAAQNAQCGAIADGCGGTLECGSCPNGTVCGLGGPNLCGSFR